MPKMSQKQSYTARRQKMANKQKLKLGRQDIKKTNILQKNETKRKNFQEVEKTKRTLARSAAVSSAAASAYNANAEANKELAKWNAQIGANDTSGNTQSGSSNTGDYGNPAYGGDQTQLGGGK